MKHFGRPLFLNKTIKTELLKDPQEFLEYCLWAEPSGYDWEIEPLHNPDWVAKQQELEAKSLDKFRDYRELVKRRYQFEISEMSRSKE